MKNDHKISVLIPVYNAEKCLRKCIDSVLKQEIDNIEIVLCDDASSDNSSAVMEEYKAKYSEIFTLIYMNENSGGSGAINAAVEAATGDYIFQIDNDDYLEPEALRKLYKVAIEEDADIVDCDVKQVDQNGEFVKIEISNTDDQIGIIDEEKRRKLIVRPGRRFTKLYKKSFLLENNIRFPDGVGYGDNYYGCFLALYVGKLYKVNEPLYCYYTNLESTTRSYNNIGVYERCKSALLMLEDSKKTGLYEKYKNEIDFRFIELYYIGSIYAFVSKFRPAETKQLKLIRKIMRYNYPKYKKNPYYKFKTSFIDKIVCTLNDIDPNLVVIMYKITTNKVGRKVFYAVNG